jgi:DNA-binding transcriptional LysR family regulator
MTSLRHLRYFLAVAEEGQMTRAAARLHLAQPALSQAISTLEEQLGVGLFERHARGVKLTPAGAAFLAKTRIALAAAADADETADSLSREASDALVIGFIGPPPMVKESALFANFATQHPDVKLRFQELAFPYGATRSWLRDVDVVFCHAPENDPAVRTRIVRSEQRVVIAPSSHPLARQGELRPSSATTATCSANGPAFTASTTIVARHPRARRRITSQRRRRCSGASPCAAG